MPDSSTLAGLFKALLSIDEESPVHASPGFRPWLGPGQDDRWPPDGDAEGGLWLLDTRDRSARRLLATWNPGARPPPFDAALVLSGSGRDAGLLRRFLRRIRPGHRRLTERRVAGLLLDPAMAPELQRWGFADRPWIPIGFDVNGGSVSSGTAFLLTRAKVFQGPLWSWISNQLDASDLGVLRLELRRRGAAVVLVQSGDARYAVRIVPPGDAQAIVHRNHLALLRLRGALGANETLPGLMPEPIFAARYGGMLVLAETLLPGILAWKASSPGIDAVIYEQAVTYLTALRRATAREVPPGTEAMAALLRPDLERLAASDFVDEPVRSRLRRELAAAQAALSTSPLMAHASHGDYGYGNLLVDPDTGQITGVIDWDTAREVDLPGIDRVNLEIQIRRDLPGVSFCDAVESAWRERAAGDALTSCGADSATGERALFGVAVCRYIIRSFSYPEVYARESAGFERALRWLARTEIQAT